MKKFIITVGIIVFLGFVWYNAHYRWGVYIDFHPNAPVKTFVKTEEQTIYMEKNGVFEPFEIRGVDLGDSIPGEWAMDFAIDEETYLRWFAQIQELGANTIRIYRVPGDAFYNAFYEYNRGRQEPLYLLQGIWVSDYLGNSHRDAYDDELFRTLQEDCRIAVDIIHGQRIVSLGYGEGSGNYRKDISPWVLGYIIGVEWEPSLVVYTNQVNEEKTEYTGQYLYTKENASPFEAMLCQVGDKMITYESKRYKEQRLVAFSNWATTDPFSYEAAIVNYRKKLAYVDVEHIGSKESFVSGMFASYHVYSFYPNYLGTMLELAQYTEDEIEDRLGVTKKRLLDYRASVKTAPRIEDYIVKSDCYDEEGRLDTYLPYLKALTRYHTMPVVITQYGATTGRGIAESDGYSNLRQGYMTEQEQGQALIDCYKDIMEAGCAGSCLFSWQDDWCERTWNTMHAVDRDNTPYWSDYQTNEQFFGLLTFDPGEQWSVSYVDGRTTEWQRKDVVLTTDDNMKLSVKYDEKFIYLMVQKNGFDLEKDVLYIPFDTTPKSGSTYCENYDVNFERECDFLLVIDGKENSRLLVQKYYEVLLARYGHEIYNTDPYLDTPDRKTPYFEKIYMPVSLEGVLPPEDDSMGVEDIFETEAVFETGKLRYGIANPYMEEFDSLADFAFGENRVEIRIPWQLLNFSNPSEMMIHDDYYEKYGIENLQIEEMYVGLESSDGGQHRIRMARVPLKGWGEDVVTHERLKRSYYMLQDFWKSLDTRVGDE